MIVLLTFVCVVLAFVALGFALALGQDWLTWRRKNKDLTAENVKLSDTCVKHCREKERAEERQYEAETKEIAALAKITQQAKKIESLETEVLALGLRAEMAESHLKDAQQAVANYRVLQETSHQRIEEQAAEIKEWQAACESNRSDLELLRFETINTSGVVKQAAALLATVA